MQIAYMNYLDVKNIFIYVNISYIHTNLKKNKSRKSIKIFKSYAKKCYFKHVLEYFFCMSQIRFIFWLKSASFKDFLSMMDEI